MRQTGTMSRDVTWRCHLGSSVLVCPRWLALVPEVNSGLKATVTLLGAGTLGVYIMLKCAPKLLAARSPTPALKHEAICSAPFEQVLTVRGLQNTGNNCFLNVILQALASSEVLLRFMDACAALTADTEYKLQGKGMTGGVSMPLAIAVSALIKDLSKLESVQRTSSPRRVMLALSLYVQHFDLASQQDAAEALIHLASALQEERGKYLEWLRPTLQSFVKAPRIYEANSYIGRRNDSRMKGGDQLLDSWRGRLPWPLEGTIASSLTCQRCGYQFSTQFQSFNDITLTPLCDREGNMIRGCSLESCLDHFTRPEWVDSVKCSNCSHKAALLSILLKSGESMLTAVTGGRSSQNQQVSRSKVKYIEECGCDEDCKCEVLTGEEGGVWRNIYTNASKQLKIGRSPQVICLQVQRVVMSHDGAMKKLTGHVTFPRVLDLFPYTVAAVDSIPLRENGCKTHNQDSSFTKEIQSRSSHTSYGTDGVFDNRPSLLYSEVSCKGGADLGHPAPESRETMLSDWKEGGRGESSAIGAEAGSEKMGSTFIPISPSVSNLDPVDKEETGNLSTETEIETGFGSTEVEDATLPSFAINLANQGVPERAAHPVDNPSTPVTETQAPTNEEATAESILGTLLKQTSSSDGILVSEQISNAHCELVEEIQPVRRSSTENGGFLSPASSIIQSIYSPYTPRVFPPILQQLTSFATPYEDQPLSAEIHGNIKMLPGLHSMSKKTTRLMPRKPKYSRNLLYQLVSVVVHQGGPQNGHYLVYRKVRIRGSNGNPTNKDVGSPVELVDDEGLGDKRNINSADRTSGFSERPAIKVSAAEGGKGQSVACHVSKVESLPDATLGKRMETSRSRVQEDQELLKCELPHDASFADNLQAQQWTSRTLLEACTNCTAIGGRGEDADALWFRISDTNVQSVQEQEVFDAQASLLFYEQL